MSWSDEPPEDRLEEPTIREIIERGRSETIEFFPSIPEKEDDLAREACGIGNHKGGVILVGVNSSGEIKDISETDAIFDRVAEILEDLIEPSLRYVMHVYEIDGENFLLIRIKKFSNIPLAMNRRFYLRKSKKSRPIPPSTVRDLFDSKSNDG
ncbi:hypothetical protein BRC91_05060 [Halobacteriales archaeon QS_4_62_28]|nr:MAG: hypothetical protein BRC91_05060 [Halobacteriales archaeon QS_4_62_28]